MLIETGPRDQRAVQGLPNYGLSYRSKVLEEDLTIAGSVDVTLHIQSNCRDTAFVAKLIELHGDGRAMLLMDGVVRAMHRDAAAGPQHLVAEQVYPLTINLGDIHHTFTAGSCMQVDITSSNFPRRVRNTNSGNPIMANDTATDIKIAKMRSIIVKRNRRSSFSRCCLSRHRNLGEPDNSANTGQLS